jgi:hypothetical protein
MDALSFSNKMVNEKGAKNLYGSYPTEFAGSTQNPKKIIGT